MPTAARPKRAGCALVRSNGALGGPPRYERKSFAFFMRKHTKEHKDSSHAPRAEVDREEKDGKPYSEPLVLRVKSQTVDPLEEPGPE